MMTMNQLASMIARLEGKKSQARIGDVRELLGILADIVYDMEPEQDQNEVYAALLLAGHKRSKKRTKRKKA